MKYCPWCSVEYPADVSFCPTDGTALLDDRREDHRPRDFDSLGLFDAEEAKRILKALGDAGITFALNGVDHRENAGHVYRTIRMLEILVKECDLGHAQRIVAAKWMI